MLGQNNLILKEETIKENRHWVRITAACNEKCLFCLDSDAQDGKLIGEDIVREKIRSGYKPGLYNRIILSGGEASINPKFSEYIIFAKELGYNRIQTVTNGNMFACPEFCKKVFDVGLQEVTISIHGHTRELHDYLTATPGSFDKALKGLIHIKKYYPDIIINIDIVVNKLNVDFLSHIIKFFMRFGIYEYDILQIIPFGRGFSEYRNILFYKIEEHIDVLHEAWKLSQIPGVSIWTNRMPAEAFEGFEYLIQDPRKIKSEVMGEFIEDFQNFISSSGINKPHCYGEACEVCFLKKYCHGYIDKQGTILPHAKKYIIADTMSQIGIDDRYVILRGEEFPSKVYEKYGNTGQEFIKKIKKLSLSSEQKLVNIPMCIRKENNDGLYEWNGDLTQEKTLGDYTENYIMNLYRKKSVHCKNCKYNTLCEGIHINFIRSYGFKILQPIIN